MSRSWNYIQMHPEPGISQTEHRYIMEQFLDGKNLEAFMD